MKTAAFYSLGLVALSMLVFGAVSQVGRGRLPGSQPGDRQSANRDAATLVETVRQATEGYKTAAAAETAGYGLFHGCVSGPQEGAMGIHLVKGDLVGDGALNAEQPEALIYEFKGGDMQLAGVEYVVLAEGWHANNDAPPVLMGQVFNYVGSPNRYGIPAFYELHVWAWKTNANGTFADWHPQVSCDDYSGVVSNPGTSH